MYTELMGGNACRHEDRPLRPYMMLRTAVNKYGEAMQVLKGIWYGPQKIITRVHEWIVKRVDPAVIAEREANTLAAEAIGIHDVPIQEAANDDSTEAANDSRFFASLSRQPLLRCSNQSHPFDEPHRDVTLE